MCTVLYNHCTAVFWDNRVGKNYLKDPLGYFFKWLTALFHNLLTKLLNFILGMFCQSSISTKYQFYVTQNYYYNAIFQSIPRL